MATSYYALGEDGILCFDTTLVGHAPDIPSLDRKVETYDLVHL